MAGRCLSQAVSVGIRPCQSPVSSSARLATSSCQDTSSARQRRREGRVSHREACKEAAPAPPALASSAEEGRYRAGARPSVMAAGPAAALRARSAGVSVHSEVSPRSRMPALLKAVTLACGGATHAEV